MLLCLGFLQCEGELVLLLLISILSYETEEVYRKISNIYLLSVSIKVKISSPKKLFALKVDAPTPVLNITEYNKKTKFRSDLAIQVDEQSIDIRV